jgi:hypothetical protein
MLCKICQSCYFCRFLYHQDSGSSHRNFRRLRGLRNPSSIARPPSSEPRPYDLPTPKGPKPLPYGSPVSPSCMATTPFWSLSFRPPLGTLRLIPILTRAQKLSSKPRSAPATGGLWASSNLGVMIGFQMRYGSSSSWVTCVSGIELCFGAWYVNKPFPSCLVLSCDHPTVSSNPTAMKDSADDSPKCVTYNATFLIPLWIQCNFFFLSLRYSHPAKVAGLSCPLLFPNFGVYHGVPARSPHTRLWEPR